MTVTRPHTLMWHRRKRHYSDLKDRLDAEGFTVLDTWLGKHLRIRVERNGRETTITCSGTPGVPEHAVTNTMQQARRATL